VLLSFIIADGKVNPFITNNKYLNMFLQTSENRRVKQTGKDNQPNSLTADSDYLKARNLKLGKYTTDKPYLVSVALIT
jgi:hypothetical protein